MIREILHDASLISFSPLIYTYAILKYGPRGVKNSILPRSLKKIRSDIIIHSSSIGEAKNALLLTKQIKRFLPQKKIQNTVFTQTAKETFPETIAMPIPLFIIQKFLIKTKNLLFFESDLWPSYIFSVKSQKGRVLVVSGKISENSAKFWRKMPILKETRNLVDHVFAKDEKNASLFEYAGFPSVSVSIDLKNLIFLEKREKLNLKLSKRIFFALSTRGEEELRFLLQGHIPEKFGLIIAPRHNFEEAEKTISKETRYEKLSRILNEHRKGERFNIEDVKDQIEESIKKGRVILVDTYGFTDEILKISDICFVGGTVSPIGGHNTLEPLSFKIPIIIGQNNWNVSDDVKKIALIVSKPHELKRLLSNYDSIKENQKIEKFVNERKKKLEMEIEKILIYIV